MSAEDAHTLMRTFDCSHPGCKEEAESGRSTCRYHRADRRDATSRVTPGNIPGTSEASALIEREVSAGRLCKVADCAGKPIAFRGPYAGLCEEHAAPKRAHHSARVSAGMGAGGFNQSKPAPETPLGVVKKLRQAAFDLEKAQKRHDEAKAELNRAKRAWKTALQDAAIGT